MLGRIIHQHLSIKNEVRRFSRVTHFSPVGGRAGVTGRTLGHALSHVDDEGVEVWVVDFGADFGTDAAPAFEAVGARRAVRHTAALVEIVHAGRARHVAVGSRAAAQALRVAALPLCGASSPSTTWRTLWRETDGKKRENVNKKDRK